VLKRKNNPTFEQEAIKPIKGQRSTTIERIITNSQNHDALKAYIKIINWQDPTNDFHIPKKLANQLSLPVL
jgi:hypothetical protein